jgi:hypothetical protein
MKPANEMTPVEWQDFCERATWQIHANSGRTPPICAACGRAIGFGGRHVGGPCRASKT